MHAWLADVDMVQLAATLAILGIIAVTIIKSWRPVRAVVRFFDAMIGGDERDRDGEKLRPGILDQVAALTAEQERQGKMLRQVHHEVHFNNGSSVKDATRRIEDTQQEILRTQTEHVKQLSEHLIAAESEREQVQEIAATVDDLHTRITDPDA